ncbi:hypothetical protein FOXB_09539 [Fusarium oxysporum f. sp. conglutinans Fo5176]|uniref:Uncharacterized protein n=1 Tax=Fusarium oxysporum (strain Fo5176) TaxID=660025 RepID=F9FT08_FUSOF|nr:hypothetical protein FOXB_09539 [Fusarium oxysporum f. sp. conglutinans Fo5176]
MTTLLSTLYI